MTSAGVSFGHVNIVARHRARAASPYVYACDPEDNAVELQSWSLRTPNPA